MQRLEISRAVRPLYWSLDVQGLVHTTGYLQSAIYMPSFACVHDKDTSDS